MFALNTQGALCQSRPYYSPSETGLRNSATYGRVRDSLYESTNIVDLAGELAHYIESGSGSAFTKPPHIIRAGRTCDTIWDNRGITNIARRA